MTTVRLRPRSTTPLLRRALRDEVLAIFLVTAALLPMACSTGERPEQNNPAVTPAADAGKIPDREPSADPELTLRSGDRAVRFARSELLRRSDVETLAVSYDPTYKGRTMSYRAVPAAALFGGLPIPDDAVIQFSCLDGFSAPIGKERLLEQRAGHSRAYIAIEAPGQPWPPVRPGGPSAGPYYLVWVDPQASFIGQEEWPYQLAGFEVKGTLESLYPDIFPDPKVGPSSAVRRGFDVFTKNCFACHTMNKEGLADVGPDLNLPMNPTEYLQAAALRKLIRDPQSLRHYPGSRMSAFPPEALTEEDLDHVIAYLEHMARRKVKK